jgi:hypothetical protein
VNAPKTPKDVVRRFLEHGRTEQGWDMEVIGECFSDSYWSHTWQGDLATTGARQGRFFSALQFVDRLSDDLLEDGEFVIHRSTAEMRHVGELFGLAPTQRVVTCEHVEMWRVVNGQIVEHWGGLGTGGQLYRALAAQDPAG